MAGGVTYPRSKVTLDLGDGTPVVVDASSWSVQRALSGSNIPGQVRAASGVGTTDGSVSFAVDDNRTPWQAGPFLPGGKAAIDAAADAGLALSPIARLLVSKLGLPGALTPERNATLTENLGALRGNVTLPVTLATTSYFGDVAATDAAWPIVQAAALGGYHVDPSPVASCVAALSLRGSYAAEVGSTYGVVSAGRWGTAADGCVIPLSATSVWVSTTQPVDSPLYVTQAISPLTSTNWADFILQGELGTITVSGTGTTLTVSARLNSLPITNVGGTGSVTVPAGAARVQTQVLWTSTQIQVRVRFDGGAWSSYVTVTTGVTFSIAPVTMIRTSLPGMQLHTADDPAIWSARTAIVPATGSVLSAVLPGTPQSSWSLIGDVAESVFGAAWIDEAGVLRFVTKESLRGMVARGADIIADTDLADLPADIGLDDVADRVQVSYQPPDLQTSTTGSITVWEATDAVQVGAGKTVTIYADLDGAADQLAPWLPVWTTSPPAAQQSRWAAATSRDGGGTQPADTALAVSATLVSPNRVRIRITNTTSSTLWTVDGNGNPTLTLRANVYATAGEAITISAGAPADTAVNPLSVDLGSWVQDADVAQGLLAWLAAMTSQPLPTLSDVDIVPDPTIRQGDVRVLRDPHHTGLVSKVLVTGVNTSYSSTDLLNQSLTLVVLGVLNWDVARWLTPARTNTQAAGLATAALGAATTNSQAAAWFAKGAIA